MTIRVAKLTQRAKQVLEAVVVEYLETGQAVGSRTVVKKHLPRVSSATVRNEMHELDGQGFLDQSHTSAGRMPTRMAMRFYVDEMLRTSKATGIARRRVFMELADIGESPEDMMKETSRKLSYMSGLAGVVVAPMLYTVRLKRIDFILLSRHKIMAVIVPLCGVVKSRIFRFNEQISLSELVKANNFLNDNFAGMTLGEIQDTISEMLTEEEAQFDALMAKALMLGNEAFSEPQIEDDIFVEGKSALIEKHDFSNIDELKAIYRAIEKKGLILKLIDLTLGERGMQVTLGAESEMREARGLSLVTGSYGRSDMVMGRLGVLGPIRMNYREIIPLVECTAELISGMME